MKTEIYIFNLNGNRAAVRDYANTIANMSASNCNAYVMAFDKDNEILWTVQAGDDLNEVKAAINWQGVRRVEIYDHSADGTYKTEQVYITSRKSLNEYTVERSASEFVVAGNNTQYTADNWQSDNNESDGNDEAKRLKMWDAADRLDRAGWCEILNNYYPVFADICRSRGISFDLVNIHQTPAGYVHTYRKTSGRNQATDEINNEQSDESSEGKKTAAEPSALAQKVAKVAESVKTYAAKGARRVALLLSLLVVLVLSVAAVFVCVSILLALFDALSITGAARVVLAFLVVLGPALELGINIECNALAVVARIFPGSFPGSMPFECFSFWGRMLRA